MRLSSFALSAFFAGSAFWDAVYAQTANQLVVKTTSGTLHGKYNATGVRAFLGVPYAFPPTGIRRFAAPIPFEPSPDTIINATSYGYNCPGEYYPGKTIYTDLPYLPFDNFSEDCLTLNVWAPSEERTKAHKGPLPIVVFIHGGYFTQGSTTTLSTDATNLVKDHDVVIVMLNYRLSIFGFPNYGNLKNVGILDQRLALEWARDNAKQFGGDPKHITLAGQSAGAISVDMHTYAKFNTTRGAKIDPIAKSIYLISGHVFIDLTSKDQNQTNFPQLASTLGCNSTDPTAILTCMREVPYDKLLDEIVTNGTARGWLFTPIADEQIVFANYTQRMLDGHSAKLPMFMSTVENEATGLQLLSPNGINVTQANQALYHTFVCPTWKNSDLRFQTNPTVYRFRYSGNWTNISPYPWLGTYHTADLPLYFGGAAPTFGGRNATGAEVDATKLLQNYLLTFAKDPKDGLRKLGLPTYNPSNSSIVVVAPYNTTGLIAAKSSSPMVMLDTSARYDAPCFT